jgi:Flp pilus assembly protein TadB
MRRLLRFLLLAGLLAGVPTMVHAQDGISKKEQERIQSKKAKEEKKAEKVREKEGKKRHLDIQSKDTRKRIKKNTKRADRHGSNRHRDGLFSRLFSRKR